MLDVLPLDSEPVLVLGAVPLLDPALKKFVDETWERERRTRKPPPFDGNLFSLVACLPPVLRGCVVPYRRFVAQRRDPSLFEKLRVRMVSVSGLVLAEDGIVFGRRAPGVNEPRRWELAPSGGIDKPRDGARAQLLKELTEETGIPASLATDITPLAMIEDDEAHTIDLCYRLRVPLTGAEIRRYAEGASGEYDRLEIVAPDALAAFLDDRDVIEVSRELLQLTRLI